MPPPQLEPGDPRHPSRDPRYADVAQEDLPLSESLKDTIARVLPFWRERIVPDIRAGRRVLVAAHGNSLRALVKYLDDMSEEAITQLNIPTGLPLVYELDRDLKPVPALLPGRRRGCGGQGQGRGPNRPSKSRRSSPWGRICAV